MRREKFERKEDKEAKEQLMKMIGEHIKEQFASFSINIKADLNESKAEILQRINGVENKVSNLGEELASVREEVEVLKEESSKSKKDQNRIQEKNSESNFEVASDHEESSKPKTKEKFKKISEGSSSVYVVYSVSNIKSAISTDTVD